MRIALVGLDQAVGADDTGGVRCTTRRGEPWISVPKLGKLPEPASLDHLKDQVERRWGTIDLLDFLKEADFLTDLTGVFTSVATREVIARDVVRRRLLFVLFGLGTNMGIKKLADGLASSGEATDTEAALRRTRWTYATGTTCAGPSCGWSTPPSLSATPACGGRAPRVPRTPRSSAPGSRT
jgi:Transposase.